MSNIVVGFDLHNWNHKRHGGPRKGGVNRRGELCLSTTHRLVDFANEHDAHLVVAGDLIDDPGPVQPQFAAQLRNELARCRGGVSLLLGNHDMTADGDHSLGIYETDGVRGIRVAERHTWRHYPIRSAQLGAPQLCMVPFHCDIRDERVRDVPLLIGHFGVFDDSFPPWLKKGKETWYVNKLFDFMKERNVQCALLGDYHSRKVWRYDGHVVSLLDEGRQKWTSTGALSRPGALLDLDSSEAQRLRAFHGERGQTTVPSYPDLAESARALPQGFSDRSLVLQPSMRQPNAHGGGITSDEYLARREWPSQERPQDALPSRTPIQQRNSAREQNKPNLATVQDLSERRAESPICSQEGLIVMQGGALNCTGWDNPGLHGYGTAALWDGERLSWRELPGPRFCVTRSDAEEKSVVDEARRLGHNLFLRRYYEGKDRPEAPEGVEAYEALPVKVERAASVCLEQVKLPQDRMQQLVSDWLESAGDDREALGALIKEYV